MAAIVPEDWSENHGPKILLTIRSNKKVQSVHPNTSVNQL